ncbi:MAG: adenylyltransferase/cytidyltransferase family protein [Chlamydiales bacterium]|nr:adenylyltransferase/cytidyltransferase family protein [Chlamydiales bacterium]
MQSSIVEKTVSCKTIAPTNLEATVKSLRAAGKTIATLNGSFDLLHAGHLQILMEGADQADVLIVALNSDDSIKRYKSSDRPIIPLLYRLQIVAALACVDYVTWFDEDDPRMVLSKIKPDVHINGAEYGGDCIEADTVKQGGGRLHLVNRIPGLSTSQIIEKIGSLCGSSAQSKTTAKA